MKYITGIIVVSLLLVGGWYFMSDDQESEKGSSEVTSTESEQKLSVVTSFYPLQFALERIVSDMGTVVNIGEGRDPHDFRPSTQDILALQQADLVVLQGVDLEPWGDAVIEQLEASNVTIHIATKGLALMEGGEDGNHEGEEESETEMEDGHGDEEKDGELHEDEEEHGAFDPHTWLDPVLFAEMVDLMTKTIVSIDPENASFYEANATSLIAELALLDTKYKNTLASCELDEVITSHDAFGYVSERYGLEIHSIAGLSTQDTPSVTTLARLRVKAEEGVGAILLEENSITAYGETLARETGLETLSINPIAYIIPSGENYLTLMQKNLDTFSIALKCNE